MPHEFISVIVVLSPFQHLGCHGIFGAADPHGLEVKPPFSSWRSLTKRVPSGYVKIAIENDHLFCGFSYKKRWFSIAMLNYQRVYNEL